MSHRYVMDGYEIICDGDLCGEIKVVPDFDYEEDVHSTSLGAAHAIVALEKRKELIAQIEDMNVEQLLSCKLVE